MQTVYPGQHRSWESQVGPGLPPQATWSRHIRAPPAVHLLALWMPPIFKGLYIIEQQPDHAISLVQVPFYLPCPLWCLA